MLIPPSRPPSLCHSPQTLLTSTLLATGSPRGLSSHRGSKELTLQQGKHRHAAGAGTGMQLAPAQRGAGPSTT